ncbi:MAG: AarF/UbiB family protein [Crocinitomicaceae bacterium]|nr:AarF/UbiB family protein [Crocinitomicaceae bacterium]
MSNRKRARKAYKVTYKILFSYLWIFLWRKLHSKDNYQQKLEALHTKNATRLKDAILELQGLFTKAGQLLSVMSGFLPEQYTEVLESLQDQAPESSFDVVKKQLEEELGESIEQLFESFDNEPIASASIGQVYKARLKSGEIIAVKVQHPNIHELAEADLDIIHQLIKRVSWFITIGGIDHVYSQVRMMIEEELDYEKEAENMQLIGQNLLETKGILVPHVFTEYSSKKVVVTAFYEGVKITNVEQLDKWKIDRSEISERLLLAFCKMILEDGLYHADPHPGNVLVNEDGDIILLDFGAVAELNQKMREEIPIIIQAIIRKDNDKILKSLRKMGFIGNDKESGQIAGKLIDAISHFLQNEVEIENMNFRDISFDDVKGSSIDKLRKDVSIKELTKTIQVPKDWILLERTILLIMGSSKTLAPELNPIDVIKPYLKNLVLKDGGLRKIIIDAIKQQLSTVLGLPSEMSAFLKKANNGELEIEVKSDNSKLYALGQQFIFALFILASVGFYLIQPATVFIISGSLFGALLLRSVWKNRK